MTQLEKSIGHLIAQKLLEAEFDFTEIRSVGLIRNANGIWNIRFFRGKKVQKGDKRYVNVILGGDKESADMAYRAFEALSNAALSESFEERLLRQSGHLQIEINGQWKELSFPAEVIKLLTEWGFSFREIAISREGVRNAAAEHSGW